MEKIIGYMDPKTELLANRTESRETPTQSMELRTLWLEAAIWSEPDAQSLISTSITTTSRISMSSSKLPATLSATLAAARQDADAKENDDHFYTYIAMKSMLRMCCSLLRIEK